MKILFVTPSTGRGGAEKILYELAAGLAKTNEVRVINIYPKDYYAAKLESAGVSVKSLQAKKLKGLRKIKRFNDLKKLKQEIDSFKPDVVHAFMYQAAQMCRLLKNNSFKLFTTPHSNYAQLGKFYRIIDAALKSKDTLSLAESNATKDFLLINQRYRKEKVVLTLNTIGPDFVKDAAMRAAFRAQHNLKDNFVIITTGRLEEEKGHKYLLDAFAKIYLKNKNARLLFAGDGSQKENLRLQACVYGIEKAVKFLGFYEDMPAALNGADLFVMPSLTESLPLSAIEAAACAKPLVLTNVGDSGQICEHGKNGFLCAPQDVIILACMIQEIMDNKTLQTQFAAHSQTVADKFKHDYAAQHLSIYQGEN